MSGSHGGPTRWRGRRGHREEGQPAQGEAQPRRDYPRAAAMSMPPEALWQAPQLPAPEDIAAARRVLETVPALIEALTVAQLSAGWEQLQWAGAVMVAAWRCQVAMARSPLARTAVGAAVTAGEPGQAARTLRTLELLDEARAAHDRGDVEEAFRIADQADAETLVLLLGAMMIGKIPEPGCPGYEELLGIMRDKVAAGADQ